MNNILLGALLFFICSTGIFGYVSYELSEQKGMAVQALQEAQDRLADSEKSKEISIFSCQITASILSEWQKDLQENQDKSEATVTAIDKLPSKSEKVVKDEVSDVVDIDGKLPSDLQRLLSEASDNHQRGSTADAK